MHVLVHGGAGRTPEEPEQRQTDLEKAATQGADEPGSVDAVESAVRHLESAPRFNAGVGGARQSDGVVRTDAGLMTGAGDNGAACSMPGIEHAVSVARAVMEETPHVLLAGEHAVRFGQATGVAVERTLLTDRSRERWGEYDPPPGLLDQLAAVRERFGSEDATGDDPLEHDTVGAVATDGDTVAAATSTGGRWFALAGRVGDVPQVGAGFYASGDAAASATGEGEAIARFGLARDVVERIEDGVPPGRATDRGLQAFEDDTDGRAGVIAIRATGDAGSAYNTDAMSTAYRGS
ncbi:MAG: isoaspartyl peptidase/L-asparaginase [Halanaeroarchaeum sp.]